MEWKSYPITKQSFKDMILNQVLPAIMSKWPKKLCQDKIKVNIQMDNATSYKGCTEHDTDIKSKLLELGMSCKFHF